MTVSKVKPDPLIGRVNSQIEAKKESIVSPKKKVNKSSIGLDWLQGSISYDSLIDILEELSIRFGEYPRISKRGLLGNYNRSCSFVALDKGYAVNVMFDNSWETAEKLHNGKMLVQITGQGMARFDYDSLKGFGEILIERFGFSCTRIDTCFNDFERIAELKEIADWVGKKCISGFRKGLEIKGLDLSGNAVPNEGKVKNSFGAVIIGHTISFGSRGKNGSGKYLRIYDKNLESNGEIDCVRYEVEWGQDRAKYVFQELFGGADSIDEFVVRLSGFIGGSVLFVDKVNGTDKNVSRLAIIPFWQKVLDLLGRCTFSLPKKETTIEGKIEYLERNTARAFATVKKTFRSEADFTIWFHNVVDQGENRMNDSDFEALEQYEKGGGLYRRNKNKFKEAIAF